MSAIGKRRSGDECIKRSLISRISHSPGETHLLGIEIARALSPPCTVLLTGSLGMGKTTLARGIAEGAGLEDTAQVSSPSFTLVNRYEGRIPIFHVDLYRLQGERDLHTVGLEDFLGRVGITVVEWGERLPNKDKSAILVEIEDLGGDSRKFTIEGLID